MSWRRCRCPPEFALDGAALADIDTASALILLSHLKDAASDVHRLSLAGFAANDARIVEQVRQRLDDVTTAMPHRREGLLAHVGRETMAVIELLSAAT